MTKTITVTLSDDVARWLRARAARNNHSVSTSVVELIEEMRRQDEEYDAAMKRSLAITPSKLQWAEGRKPTRDELHDRPCLRPRRLPD